MAVFFFSLKQTIDFIWHIPRNRMSRIQFVRISRRFVIISYFSINVNTLPARQSELFSLSKQSTMERVTNVQVTILWNISSNLGIISCFVFEKAPNAVIILYANFAVLHVERSSDKSDL